MEFEQVKTFEELDKQAFCELVQSGFGRKLVSDYFDYVKPEFVCVAKQDGVYYGAIVVERVAGALLYLDKIVVRKESQGNGIGKELLQYLNQTKLIWRAKPQNPINASYMKHCDGMQKQDGWIVYWKGLNPEEIAQGIAYAMSKKPTLEEIVQ